MKNQKEIIDKKLEIYNKMLLEKNIRKRDYNQGFYHALRGVQDG